MKLREIISLIEEYGNIREDMGYEVNQSVEHSSLLGNYKNYYKQSIELLEEIREGIKNYDG